MKTLDEIKRAVDFRPGDTIRTMDDKDLHTYIDVLKEEYDLQVDGLKIIIAGKKEQTDDHTRTD